MQIDYIDRKTGKKCKEKIYGGQLLSLLYGDSWFSKILYILFLPLISYFPWASKLYGRLQSLPSSQKKVQPFIKEYEVDPSEFESQDFSSFQDFFIRKLKKEKRPVVQDETVLAAPADARYLVYPQFESLNVKGKEFSLEDFLANRSLASRYSEGSLVIARLCPSDYHRFHFPVDGIPSKAEAIQGSFYSVNPIALKKRFSILSENRRFLTEIENKLFGTILYVEIGATFVGSVHQTYLPEKPVQKGDEKGYFEFGASCIVLLFEKGSIAFDEDLIKNTEQGLETRLLYGESLGKALKS